MHRLEYGNIGNWYIASATLQALARRGFRVRTTWQIAPATLRRLGLAQSIEILPRDYMSLDGVDLYVDLHGGLWGYNSLLLGVDRLQASMAQTAAAQAAGIPTAMIGSSPGPFETLHKEFRRAQHVFDEYDLVVARDAVSLDALTAQGVAGTSALVRPCPSVLFDEPATPDGLAEADRLRAFARGRPMIGIAVSAWNLPRSSWDATRFSTEQIGPLVELVTALADADVVVVVVSHSNGFSVDSGLLRRLPGRDRLIVDALAALIGCAEGNVFFVRDLVPADMHTVIGCLDGLVAGRVHAGMAAVSQGVPVQFLDYLNGPPALKVSGFAGVLGQVEPVALSGASGTARRLAASALGLPAQKAGLASDLPSLKAAAEDQFDRLMVFP